MPENQPSPTAVCAECPFKNAEKLCMTPGGKHPEACPTLNQKALFDAAMAEYATPEIAAFARNASVQEGAGYAGRDKGYAAVRPFKPRLLEIAEFARRMEYRRLGLIFCAGLTREGKRVGEFYREKGFEVVSAICKVGQIPKEKIGVKDEEKIAIGRHESICNPIAQAMLMNAARTELNIVLGLCVGHDSMVFKYSEAPCTVLAAKDRVFGHNPLAAVYTLDSYYRYLKEPME